jgi:hypothetical protein
MNLKPKVMKTQISKKNRIEKFEELSGFEMSKLFGGGDNKKVHTKTAKEKDVFDPDEH